MPDEQPEHLIGPYLFGELSAEDAERVRIYLESQPALQGYVAGVKGAMRSADIPRAPAVPDAIARLTARLGREVGGDVSDRAAVPERVAPPHAIVGHRRSSRGAAFSRTIMAALAVVVVVIGAGTFVARRHADDQSGHTYTTRTGQHASLTLADGTKVMLAPQTTLIVESGFGHTTRQVTLSGEAYFDVHTTAGTPFLVRTGAVTTRVLGTAFNVRYYHADPSVQIAVQSGKVVAAGHGAPVTLAAGRMGYVTDSSSTQEVVRDLGSYTEWTQGFLVFNETPVRTMLASLGRWYGYDFRLADSTIAERRLSATFKVSDPTEMMTMLKIGLDVTMSFDGDVVTLIPHRDGRESVRARTRSNVIKPSMEMGK